LVLNAQGETPAGPGSCVFVAPNELHQFRNAGDTLLRIICIVPNTLPKLG